VGAGVLDRAEPAADVEQGDLEAVHVDDDGRLCRAGGELVARADGDPARPAHASAARRNAKRRITRPSARYLRSKFVGEKAWPAPSACSSISASSSRTSQREAPSTRQAWPA